MFIPRNFSKNENLLFLLLFAFSRGTWDQSCIGHCFFKPNCYLRHSRGRGGVLCLCPQSLVTFTHRPTTADRCSQCSQTFGKPSQSCSPETRLCCVILSGQVTKGWTQRCVRRHQTYMGRISRSLYTNWFIEGWIKPRGELLCCCEGKFLRGFWDKLVAAHLYLFHSWPTPHRSELHRWQDTEWIPARSHQSHCVSGSGSSSPHLPRWLSGPVDGNPWIHRPPHPAPCHPLRHTPTPMCSGLRAKPQRQASSLAQLAWPRSAGFAIIILGHLIQMERMHVSSSTKANEPHQEGPTGLLLASFPLNDLLTTHFNVIVGQGGVLHTLKMSPPPF